MTDKISDKDIVVVLNDGETFSILRGCVVMQLAPGDSRKLADGEFVDPLNVYDMADPVDLRRLADVVEGSK